MQVSQYMRLCLRTRKSLIFCGTDLQLIETPVEIKRRWCIPNAIRLPAQSVPGRDVLHVLRRPGGIVNGGAEARLPMFCRGSLVAGSISGSLRGNKVVLGSGAGGATAAPAFNNKKTCGSRIGFRVAENESLLSCPLIFPTKPGPRWAEKARKARTKNAE
jgi:hypothetical protein